MNCTTEKRPGWAAILLIADFADVRAVKCDARCLTIWIKSRDPFQLLIEMGALRPVAAGRPAALDGALSARATGRLLAGTLRGYDAGLPSAGGRRWRRKTEVWQVQRARKERSFGVLRPAVETRTRFRPYACDMAVIISLISSRLCKRLSGLNFL